MKYDPQKHHRPVKMPGRRSIRIPGYDYSQAGWYFVTICIHNKEWLFGSIVENKMVLSQIGKVIDFYWKKLLHHFKNIELDKYQIMPNHFHGIIHIVGAKHPMENNSVSRLNIKSNASPIQRPHGTIPGSLGAIMQNFQSITCRKINKINKTPGNHLWQRNYWEHVIRDEDGLNRIRHYIINNPLKWPDDKYFG